MPSRISFQRFERSIADLRGLVDSGSPSVVRDVVAGSNILSRRRKYPIPGIGIRSGKLTVTGYIQGAYGGVKALIVRCDCSPDEYPVDAHAFKDFKSTRCLRCARTAGATKRYWVYIEALPDDEHRRRLLNRLASAIGRCHKPSNKAYPNYGQRGITVFQGWTDNRASFLRYVQQLEGWDNPAFDMDRIDNNKGYQPGNIRFISRKDNTNNRRLLQDLEEEVRRLRHRLSRYEK